MMRIRMSESDFKKAKALADNSSLKMSEYLRLLIQINYSILLISEGKEPEKIASEFGFQLNEEFMHNFVNDMDIAFQKFKEYDLSEAIIVDDIKPSTRMKETFKKPKQVA